jgi:hypothetical protein
MADKNDETGEPKRVYKGGPKVPLFAEMPWGTLDCASISLCENVLVKVRGRKEPEERRRPIPQRRLLIAEAIAPDHTTEADLQDAYGGEPIKDFYLEPRDFNGAILKGGRTITLGYEEGRAPAKNDSADSDDDESGEGEDEDGDEESAELIAAKARIEAMERDMSSLRDMMQHRADAPAQNDAVTEMIKSQASLLQQLIMRSIDGGNSQTEKAVALAEAMARPDNDVQKEFHERLRDAERKHLEELRKRDDELNALRRAQEQERLKHIDLVSEAIKERDRLHRSESDDLRKAHEKAITKLEKDSTDIRDELKGAKIEMRDAIKESQSEHRDELKELRATHRDEVAALRKAHENELDTLRKSSERAFDDMRARGRKEETQVEAESDRLRQELHAARTERAIEVSRSHGEHDKKIDDLRRMHETEMGSVRKRLEDDNIRLQREVADLIREKANMNTPDEVRSKIEEVRDGLAAVASKDDPAWLKGAGVALPIIGAFFEKLATNPPAQPPPVQYIMQAPQQLPQQAQVQQLPQQAQVQQVPVQQAPTPIQQPAPVQQQAPAQPSPAASVQHPAPVALDLAHTVTLGARELIVEMPEPTRAEPVAVAS